MDKDRVLRVRIDEYTEKRIDQLAESTGLSKSEIVRRSISMFESGKIMDIFGVDIAAMLLPFDGAFDVEDFGIVDNNYLSGKGFWLILKPNRRIRINKGFTSGVTQVWFDQGYVFIKGGFLANIQQCLAILYNTMD